MYSILFRVVKDRDIYMYYKKYVEEKEIDEIYKTSDIAEVSEKVKSLMESGVSLGDIKVVKDVDIDVVLNLSETEDNSTDNATDDTVDNSIGEADQTVEDNTTDNTEQIVK